MSAIESVAAVANNVLDKFVADRDLKQKLEHEFYMELQKANIAQIQVNQEQAKHSSLFVSGARPAIMWVCCLGLCWSFFIAPILNWFLFLYDATVPLPEINTEGLLTLTLSLLGLGGFRSYEKINGVARDNIRQ
tara:strand:- start:10 stop:411 length:402 start_codon:yes stop_codon:yes gene_type:complete